MKILLIGYGKMGKTIEQLALAKGHEIVGKMDHDSAAELSRFSFENTDVAIEFTHPEAAFGNISYCLKIIFRWFPALPAGRSVSRKHRTLQKTPGKFLLCFKF
jgi:dihydrodipicolinate reductase